MKFHGKSWDNSQIYASLASPAYTADQDQSRALVDSIKKKSLPLRALLASAATLPTEELPRAATILQSVFGDWDLLVVKLRNLSVYANCIISVEGDNADAKKAIGTAAQLSAEAEEALVTARLLLDTCSEALVAAFLDSDATRPHTYMINPDYSREQFLRKKTLCFRHLKPTASSPGERFTTISAAF